MNLLEDNSNLPKRQNYISDSSEDHGDTHDNVSQIVEEMDNPIKNASTLPRAKSTPERIVRSLERYIYLKEMSKGKNINCCILHLVKTYKNYSIKNKN